MSTTTRSATTRELTSFLARLGCEDLPAADALLQGMEEHGLRAEGIARVHAAVIDVLGPVSDPRTVHQSKFSMGFVLAAIVNNGSAGIDDFTEEALENLNLRRFSEKVEMVLYPKVDAAYPQRWIGLVDIETADEERFTFRHLDAGGDFGNPLSQEELEAKARKLAAYGGGASASELDRILARIRGLEEETDVRDLLPAGSE